MYKSSKYSDRVNQELEIRALDVLANSEDALSIQQIQQKDIILSSHTPQKLAQTLGRLVDMGFVKKGKSRTNNRMLYKSVSVMLAQGYEIDSCNNQIASANVMSPAVPNWELSAERILEN